jgi:hypothetical protein
VVPKENWLPREMRMLWNAHPSAQTYQYTRPERCSAESIITAVSGRSAAPDCELTITQTQTPDWNGSKQRDPRTLEISLREVGTGPLYFKAMVDGKPADDPVSTLKAVMSFLRSEDSRPMPINS